MNFSGSVLLFAALHFAIILRVVTMPKFPTSLNCDDCDHVEVLQRGADAFGEDRDVETRKLPRFNSVQAAGAHLEIQF